MTIVSMRSDAAAVQPPTRQPVRAALASFVGTTIEWYDFYVYATASALVFGHLFFTNESPFMGTLASFGTFAVGFFFRPIGGLFFGHFGDRFGRKRALVTTLLMMGIATTLIGLLPTYTSIGMWAPVALVALRAVQGIAVGGEWGGAVLLAGEHATAKRRTFFASFAQLGSPAGLILSLLAFRLSSLLDPQTFMVWGWRIPFLVSVIMLAIGLFIRLKVSESPEFVAMAKTEKSSAAPVVDVLKTSLKPVLLAIGANTIGISSVYLFNTFMISYATKYLGLPRPTILDALFIAAIVQFISQPIGATIAEKIGERLYMQLALIYAMVMPYVLFNLVDTGSFWLIALGLGLNVIGSGTFYAVVAGYVSGAFPTRIRYTAISISYQFCGAIAGGLTPIVGTILAEQYKGHWWPIAAFATFMAGLSLICITLLAPYRTRQIGLDATAPAR